MVADPCNCPLVPGIYGTSEGMLARVKQSLFQNTDQTCGYILWVPDYHCSGDVDSKYGTSGTDTVGANLFLWVSNDPYQQPYNFKNDNESKMSYGSLKGGFTAATQYSSAFRYPDPASALVKGSMVQDARTISACIAMTYTGQARLASGEVAFIEDLPLISLIEGADGKEAVSVNQLFQNSTKTARLGVNRLEIVSRPDENSHTFRDDIAAPIDCNITDLADFTTRLSQQGRTQSPGVFGFAWRGLSVDSATASAAITFELVKNIEWRPEPISGFTHAAPRTVSAVPQIQAAVAHLDRKKPGWSTRALRGLGHFAGRIGKEILTSAENTIIDAIRHPQQTLPYMAPLLLA